MLWAEVQNLDIVIHHASPVSAPHVRVATISYAIDKTTHSAATKFCSRLVDRAYGASLRRKRIKVLVNPFGGQGYAEKLYKKDIEPVFEAAKLQLDVVRTQYSGHAVELAEQLDLESWDVVACISGDGLPHEVFNGLGKRKDAARALQKIAVVQLPAGSGNAMTLNLNGTDSPSLAALCVVKGLRMSLDLVSFTQGDRRMLSFLSQSFGLIAETDLGTENLRWMGDMRFTYGLLMRLLGKTVYPCDVAVKIADDSKASIKKQYSTYLEQSRTSIQPAQIDLLSNGDGIWEGLPPLRFGTVRDPLPSDWEMKTYATMGNFYAGNMAYMARDTNFFQAALPNDGFLDLINVDGNISRLSALKMLFGVANGKLFDMDLVSYRKIEGYRIIPHPRKPGTEGFISIDGERVPFEPFQVEIHRGLGTVLGRNGRSYEVPILE